MYGSHFIRMISVGLMSVPQHDAVSGEDQSKNLARKIPPSVST